MREANVRPRITINLSADGELEVSMNEQGRDLLVRELQKLSETNDHFHLAPKPMGEVELSSRAYRPDDKVLEWGKVMFRPDAWDQKYYPHVMSDDAA
jgi:hypothetical protein